MSINAEHRTHPQVNGPTLGLPSVSVVIPTRNRAPYLRDLLNALSVQVYPSDRLEVLVIDNSSSDDTREVVRESAAIAPYSLRYLRKDDDGPAASRNRGAEMATGDVLAFTDSDCIPSPNWIRLAVAHLRPGVGVVCGPVRPLPIGPDDPFFLHQIHAIEREDGLYATANVFYLRAAFLSLGGFQEDMRTYSWGQPVGGDDTELAWRIKRASYQSAFADDAFVYHQATPISMRSYLMQTAAAQVLPQLVARFPELRRSCLYRRYFLHGQSATFYPFVAGLLLAEVTPWSLLLTAPWLKAAWPALKMDIWPPRRWPRAAARLALEVESSTLLAAALMRGSMRNRSVVL